MKKQIAAVFVAAGFIAAQPIRNWEPNTSYSVGDIVYYNGSRYVAGKDNALAPDDTLLMIPAEENNGIAQEVAVKGWMPILPRKELLTRSRMGPETHHDFWKQLKNDNFVIQAARSAGLEHLMRHWDKVGLAQEKTKLRPIFHKNEAEKYEYIPSDWHWDDSLQGVHSAWQNLMELNSPVVGEPVSNRRYLGYPAIFRNCEYGASEAVILHPFPFLLQSPNSFNAAMEQLIHNLGDAGAMFGHALGGLGNTSDEEHVGVQDAYEHETFDQYHDRNMPDFLFFPGTVEEAVREYKNNISEDFAKFEVWDASHLITYTKWTFGYLFGEKDYYVPKGDAEEFFAKLIKGGTDGIHGTVPTAGAVGRAILVDMLLAQKPLENAVLRGNPQIGESGRFSFSAFAKDPDAVRLKRVTDPVTKVTKDTIEYDPALQAEGGQHETSYEWFMNNIPVGKGQHYDFDVTYSVKSGNTVTSITVQQVAQNGQTEYPKITIPVSNNSINLTVHIRDDEYAVRPNEESNDWTVVPKTLSFNSRPPVPQFDIKKVGFESDAKPFVAVRANSTDFEAPYVNDYGLSVTSGFVNPSCYNDVSIDGFRFSRDPDGTSNDQIQNVLYDIANNIYTDKFAWEPSVACVRGVNQQTYIPGSDNLVTEQVTLKNEFLLKSDKVDAIHAENSESFLSSQWTNYGSPAKKELEISAILHSADKTSFLFGENHEFSGVVRDNENAVTVKKVPLPILSAPVISGCSMKIVDRATETELTKFESAPLQLDGSQLLVLSVSAFDPDNKLPNAGLSTEWGICKKGDYSSIGYSQRNWGSSFTNDGVFTYRDLINHEFIPNEPYEVYARVSDDDGFRTGIEGGYGVSIVKLGEFTMSAPAKEGDVNLDGVVDQGDVRIVVKNSGTENPEVGIKPYGTRYISNSYLTNRIYGDLNNDNLVNNADLAIVKRGL